jgi:hypothetical protein
MLSDIPDIDIIASIWIPMRVPRFVPLLQALNLAKVDL